MLVWEKQEGPAAPEIKVACHWPELSHDRNDLQRLLGSVVHLGNLAPSWRVIDSENRKNRLGGGKPAFSNTLCF